MILKAILMDENAIARSLKRVSHEIIEKNKGTNDVVLVGIKRRGVPIAERISLMIEKIEGKKIQVGSVDITLYRDDLTILNEQPIKSSCGISVEIRNKNVILVDDVLYTGRTVRAAIEAIIAVDRPKTIQLAVLVDRGHRELPIRADFVGKNIPTSKSETVSVKLLETDENDSVSIYE